MNIFTYEIVLVSNDGYEKTKIVSCENCISALNKAKKDCGKGWSIKNYRIIFAK